MANSPNTSPDSLNYNQNKRQSKMNSRTTYNAGFQGTAVKRIRTPHPHDVLSGRGGGINSHEGNVVFRRWVADRKNDYNLAPNKAQKALVAREVIELVYEQSPPGRFLQKDPASLGGVTWWVELNDEKIMAKTSQALREGAPQIRAAHKEEIAEMRAMKTRRNAKRCAPTTHYVEPTSPSVDKPKVFAELHANMEAAARDAPDSFPDTEERPNKQLRIEYQGQIIRPEDATPPLLPTAAPTQSVEPMNLSQSFTIAPPPMPAARGYTRAHSLALSDTSFGDLGEEFINPFENEGGFESSTSLSSAAPRPGVVRDSSLSNKSDSSYNNKFGRKAPGVRSSSSSRYAELDEWMDNVLATPEPWIESQ